MKRMVEFTPADKSQVKRVFVDMNEVVSVGQDIGGKMVYLQMRGVDQIHSVTVLESLEYVLKMLEKE